MCLAGPPGTGKTSIGIAIAEATGRKFARVSLGGMRDEADIRGHRKTYIGAMPGRIINAMRQAGSRNPVILLDEIDKMSSDFRGDPASAMLEVLDTEQNHAFRDHYIELPFDISEVLFIMTANDVGAIPRPLLDRMELIELSSYTDEEKVEIARRHLLPRELKRHGLRPVNLRLPDDMLRTVISAYTRESGVRGLERQIAAICRKCAKKIASGEARSLRVNDNNIEELLGPKKFKETLPAHESEVGVVTGLAWTAVGGEILPAEVNILEGSGKIELTGNLGDVMKESAAAAVSCVRARAERYHIEKDFYKKYDIHIHFPEGAVPKDGPSAGVTIVTALVSALTGRAVPTDLAMTGEITIRGRVLAIGGLREKTMAAMRHGAKRVIIPAENLSDLAEIDPKVREALSFIPAEDIDTVLSAALLPPKEDAAENKPAEVGVIPCHTELPKDKGAGLVC
ncbi:MAG: endopeptidase La [Clostridia bacterium]|nr:endopeptidase La [Clostridia bacterium]